jgi:transposase
MRGPKPKYPIQLTTEEATKLRRLARAHKTPQSKAKRARIILAAHEHPEWSNQQIAREVGCSDRTVRTWRRRWVESKNLDDLPRPGAPRRFSP